MLRGWEWDTTETQTDTHEYTHRETHKSNQIYLYTAYLKPIQGCLQYKKTINVKIKFRKLQLLTSLDKV